MKHSLGRKLFAPHRLCEYALHRVELPLQRGKVQRPLCSRSLSSGCKVPQTGGLSTHLSLRLLQAGKSETTVPTASAPGEGALPGLQTLPSHWVLRWERVSSGLFFSLGPQVGESEFWSLSSFFIYFYVF